MKYSQKILVIRFSSIGDIVLATSPLNTIRSAFPNAKITFLTLEKFSSLLDLHPHIDRLISIPSKMKFRELWSFGGYLKRNGYDLIYDLHNSLRSNIVTFQSRSHVFQLQKPRWKRMMLFYFHKNYFYPQFSTRSMYHEYLGSIWNGDHSSIPPTSLRLSDGELKRGKRIISDLGIYENYIAIVPGAAWNQKQWPAYKYIELLNKIDIPVILIGSSKDKICQEIHSGLNNSLDLSGRTNLREALSIVANSRRVIGSDTGLVHAAEALGVDVTMIMGPTSTETGAGVSLPNSNNIEIDLWCRPCSQNGSAPCYREKQYCMESIEPIEVLKSITSSL